jgi:hypothetical protein
MKKSPKQHGKKDVPMRGLMVRTKAKAPPMAADEPEPTDAIKAGYVPGLDDEDSEDTDPIKSATRNLFQSRKGGY